MSEPIEFRSGRDVASNKTLIQASMDDIALMRMLPGAVLDLIARGIADRYVEEHYGEIAAKLDQNAIANLSIADAGKKIAEEIRAKPTVLHETKTIIQRRGFFG
jgi:hypothetical protein